MSASCTFSWASHISAIFLMAAASLELLGCVSDQQTSDPQNTAFQAPKTLDQKKAETLLIRFAEVATPESMQHCLAEFSRKYKAQTVTSWYVQPNSADDLLHTFVAYKGVFCSLYKGEGIHPGFVIFKADDPKARLWLTRTTSNQSVLQYRGLYENGEVQFSSSLRITSGGPFFQANVSTRPSFLTIARSIAALKQP